MGGQDVRRKNFGLINYLKGGRFPRARCSRACRFILLFVLPGRCACGPSITKRGRL